MANPAFSTRYRLPDGRYAVDVTEAKTLAAEDSGIVQNVTVANTVVTLPAVATQGVWTIRDGGVKATNGPEGAIVSASTPRIDPNANDTLAGFNVEGAEQNGKYITNTGGQPGDEVTVANTGATDGGLIIGSKGDWLREA